MLDALTAAVQYDDEARISAYRLQLAWQCICSSPGSQTLHLFTLVVRIAHARQTCASVALLQPLLDCDAALRH
jgi:hypothetical protein